jgi:hypothetical protein
VSTCGYATTQWRGGRRKPKTERKELFFRIRVTAEWKDRLDRAAKRDNLTASAWALRLLLREAGQKPD